MLEIGRLPAAGCKRPIDRRRQWRELCVVGGDTTRDHPSKSQKPRQRLVRIHDAPYPNRRMIWSSDCSTCLVARSKSAPSTLIW